jgi:hypothetical protein
MKKGKKSKRCGFGKVYNMKTKSCRKMSRSEMEEVRGGKIKGYAKGMMAGRLAGPKGTAAGALVGYYAGGKSAKKKISKR